MIREMTAMGVRKNLGELLNAVKYRHDNVLIKKAGKPVAALIDIDLFEKIKNLRRQFTDLTLEINKVYQSEEADLAEREITEAFREIRKK